LVQMRWGKWRAPTGLGALGGGPDFGKRFRKLVEQ
jgi:hypothetical protein